MRTQRAQGSPLTRLAGAGAIVTGWVLLAVLAAGRAALGAPQDLGLLIAGAAFGLAMVATGAALLLADTLNAGFGALDAFFTAALARATQRREDARPAPPPQQPQRGYIGDRPFVANSDGTVTVETLFGPRLFPSLADAQDFVGS